MTGMARRALEAGLLATQSYEGEWEGGGVGKREEYSWSSPIFTHMYSHSTRASKHALQ